MTECDVLIVGGGPAGLAAARAAAARGTVLVVHMDKEIGRPVRTSGGTWQREADAFGIPPTLYRPVRTLCFAGPTRQCRFAFERARPVILDVTGTYRFLAERAREAGAEIRCGHRFRRVVTLGADRAECEIAAEGGRYRVRPRYLVDASGGWRAVLAQLHGIDRPQRYGIGVEYEFDDPAADDDAATLFVGTTFAPAGYGWAFRTVQRTTRLGIGIIRPETDAAPGRLLDAFLQSPLPARLGLGPGRRIATHGGVIPCDGVIPALARGRVVAIGDSAGQALPLVGEGIRFSIESGERAGAALAAALGAKGDSAAALDRYARWWDRRYRRRFALAQRINQRISRYADPDWDRALDLLRPLSGDELAPLFRMELSVRTMAKLVARNPRLVGRLARRALCLSA